jgi:hypothetical protein
MSRAAIAVYVLLFVYLAGGLGVLWLAMKPIPACVLLAPLAAHAVASAARAGRVERALAAFSTWVGLALASTVGMYAAAELVHPPITEDGHMVMPIGQAFFAIVVGPIVGVALGYLIAKKVDAKPLARRLVLHGLLVLLGAIAIERVARASGGP